MKRSSALPHLRSGTLLLLLLTGTGCMTWHTEEVAPETYLSTHYPSQLRVTRTDGTQITLENPALQGGGITGRGVGSMRDQVVLIPLTDVNVIETRHVNSTPFLAVAVIAMMLGLLGLFVVSHLPIGD